MKIFSGKIALITGGTSGIGYAFAERLRAEGMTVIVCGRDQAKLERTAASLPGVVALPCDVTDTQAVSDLLAHIDTEFGRLDLLVSNAGGLVERDFVRGELPASIEEEIRVNLTPQWHWQPKPCPFCCAIRARRLSSSPPAMAWLRSPGRPAIPQPKPAFMPSPRHCAVSSNRMASTSSKPFRHWWIPRLSPIAPGRSSPPKMLFPRP